MPGAPRTGWFDSTSCCAASLCSGRSDRLATIYEDRRQEEDSASGPSSDLESRATGECVSRASSRASSRTSSRAHSRSSNSSAPASFTARSSRSRPVSTPITTNSRRGSNLKKRLISNDEPNCTSPSSRSSTYSESSSGSQNDNEAEDSTMRTDASNSASVPCGNIMKGSTTRTYASNSVSVQYDIMDPDHQLMVEVTDHGGIKKLVVQELGYIPKPNRPDQIVIMVHCSTVTIQDCMMRRSNWYEMQKIPFVPGSDIVGTIFFMGDEASKRSTFQVGDKVAAVVPSGGNAKYITLSYQSIIRVPPETDSIMALCLSSTYVPAREALDLGRKFNTPLTGENVLVIAGNEPPGLAAIELALLEGANVFTAADERHHGYLSTIGAKCFPIDPDEWLPSLRGMMDVVLDSVCLDGYESSILALNSAGTLVCTGMSAVYTQGQMHVFGMADVRDYKAVYYRMKAKFMLGRAIYYDRVERYDQAPDEYAQHFLYLCHLVSKNSLKPRLSSCSSLDHVMSTQKAIKQGRIAYGVCVCTPWTTKRGPST